jgi:hypothetical protein
MPSATPHDADGKSGLPSSPFVPCVEDAAYTRQVGRYPVAFQRTLDAVSHDYLVAQSHLAKNPCDGSARAACVATLVTNYTHLWEQREQVPKAARREWLETVMVHLHALGMVEVGVLWLVDQVDFLTEIGVKSQESATRADAHPSLAASSSTTATAAAVDDGGRVRKQSKGKAASQDTSPPLWYLWQDMQRHLHHLTLRLHTWTPAGGGAYAAREALRPSDLVRMDSSAFTWRVRLWTQVGCAALNTSTGLLRVSHPAVGMPSSCEEQPPSWPSATSPFAEEEPELLRILNVLVSSTPFDNDAALARRQVAGALLYRMLLEVALVRLRALPRCLFTWRLLRDLLRRWAALVAEPSTQCTAEQRRKNENHLVVLQALIAYVEDVVIPYLEQRDCHFANSKRTATEVHARFARLSRQRLEALHAAVVESEGRLAEATRTGIGAAVSNAVRAVCAYDEYPSGSLAVASDILSNDDEDGANGVMKTADYFTTSVAGGDVAHIMHKELDDRLFHAASHRTSQLAAFFCHYFTQSPTMAFDQLHKSTAATDTSSVGEGE